MLGLHAWPLAKVSAHLWAAPGEGKLWLDLSLLLLAMAFFGAKFAGVRWLRLGGHPRGHPAGPWMGTVAFLVACGLVHGDRVDPKDPAVVAAVALVSTAGAAEGALRVRRRTPERVRGAGRGWGSVLLIAAARGWLDVGAPIGHACAGPVLAAMPRGPPPRAFR